MNSSDADTGCIYFVEYRAQDGETAEARLGGAPSRTFVGARLRVKHLLEKPKQVIPAKQAQSRLVAKQSC